MEQKHNDCSCDTGKRGDVRTNNSGQPVDHSGPVLRVGRTTSNTADRKSEACPPESVSQHKSGQRASEASEHIGRARLALRSEAEQRTSLDQLENNRHKFEEAESKAREQRNEYCGAFTVTGIVNGRQIFRRVNCGCWDCGRSGPRKAKLYRWCISRIAEKYDLSRFLTLTLDPAKIDCEPVRYLRRVFNKFREYLRRKFGTAIKFIAVLEFHKSGVPHLHVLVDRFIKQQWISKAWDALGGGKIVFITIVDLHRISHYLSKYLTKELLLSAPKRSRRVTCSRSIQLLEKMVEETPWILLRTPIIEMYRRLYLLVIHAVADDEGVLKEFATSATL